MLLEQDEGTVPHPRTIMALVTRAKWT